MSCLRASAVPVASFSKGVAALSGLAFLLKNQERGVVVWRDREDEQEGGPPARESDWSAGRRAEGVGDEVDEDVSAEAGDGSISKLLGQLMAVDGGVLLPLLSSRLDGMLRLMAPMGIASACRRGWISGALAGVERVRWKISVGRSRGNALSRIGRAAYQPAGDFMFARRQPTVTNSNIESFDVFELYRWFCRGFWPWVPPDIANAHLQYRCGRRLAYLSCIRCSQRAYVVGKHRRSANRDGSKSLQNL